MLLVFKEIWPDKLLVTSDKHAYLTVLSNFKKYIWIDLNQILTLIFYGAFFLRVIFFFPFVIIQEGIFNFRFILRRSLFRTGRNGRFFNAVPKHKFLRHFLTFFFYCSSFLSAFFPFFALSPNIVFLFSGSFSGVYS